MLEPHIVFVDDNPDDPAIANWQLSKAGISTTLSVVATAETLTAELARRRPQLIVSDFTMPAFDGFGALRISRILAPRVPFIFHSGTIGVDRSQQAIAAGAFGAVEKGLGNEFVTLATQALSSTADSSAVVAQYASLAVNRKYVLGLLEEASHIEIGKTWVLDKSVVMLDLKTGEDGFRDVQRELEADLLGTWEKGSSVDGKVHIYKRVG